MQALKNDYSVKGLRLARNGKQKGRKGQFRGLKVACRRGRKTWRNDISSVLYDSMTLEIGSARRLYNDGCKQKENNKPFKI